MSLKFAQSCPNNNDDSVFELATALADLQVQTGAASTAKKSSTYWYSTASNGKYNSYLPVFFFLVQSTNYNKTLLLLQNLVLQGGAGIAQW